MVVFEEVLLELVVEVLDDVVLGLDAVLVQVAPLHVEVELVVEEGDFQLDVLDSQLLLHDVPPQRLVEFRLEAVVDLLLRVVIHRWEEGPK